MHVSIIAQEQPRWLFRHLPPNSTVVVRVDFDAVETAIIRKYKLLDHVIIARKPMVVTEIVVDDDGKETTLKREIDQNLRLGHFFGRDARFEMPHPAAAKAFITELKEELTKLKQFLEANGAHADPIIFEL